MNTVKAVTSFVLQFVLAVTLAAAFTVAVSGQADDYTEVRCELVTETAAMETLCQFETVINDWI